MPEHLGACVAQSYYFAMHRSNLPVENAISDPWLQPPAWIERCLGDARAHELPTGDASHRLRARSSVDGRWHCVSVCVADAGLMPPLDLQQATIEAYRLIRQRLCAEGVHAVRFWNFIPDITAAVDDNLDRYMVFNAGRFAAYTEWSSTCKVAGDIATASGVGHQGDDLYIHCLAHTRPGIAVENPRQIPAWRYSPRYGPFPPSFTRATIHLDADSDRDILFVGGTASICGEQSLHRSNLQQQTQETLQNLATVIKAGAARRAGIETQISVNGDLHAWLALMRDVRVYFVNEAHRIPLQRLVETITCDVQWVRADLCRPELLVEIEALCDLPRNLSHLPIAPSDAACGSSA